MRQVTARLLLLVLLTILVWQGVAYVSFAAAAISFPFELDYGEGIVWEQARQLFTAAAYGPIDRIPTVVFHYPPLFHLVARGVASASEMDGLAAGRLVSIVSTLGTTVAVGTLATWLTGSASNQASRLGAGIVAALLVLSVRSIVNWSVLMRVDMLAHLFSLTGLVFGVYALRRQWLVVPAALCFLLSVYTKQTSIAAPAAYLLVTIWLRPRLAVKCLTLCITLGLVILALLTHGTDGGFPRHIFLYNVNRIVWAQVQILYVMGERSLPLVVAAAFSGIAMWSSFRTSAAPFTDVVRRQVRTQELQAVTFLILGAYAVLTALSLVTIVKSGASYNYTIEFTLVLCVFAGAGVAKLFDAARIASHAPLDIAFVSWTLANALLLSTQSILLRRGYRDRLDAQEYSREMESLRVRVQNTAGPVIADDMVLLLRAGKRLELEPAIVTELASVGAWDEMPYVGRIKAREFGLIVSREVPGAPRFSERHTPAVTAAMLQYYPVRETVAGLVLSMPAR